MGAVVRLVLILMVDFFPVFVVFDALGIGQRLVKRDAELRGDDAVAFGDAHQDRVIERGMTDGTVELNRAWRWRR